VLQIGGRDDSTALGLDDVSLISVTPPIFQSATRSGNAINLSFSGQAGVGYQLQYANAIEPFDWMNLGSPITATNALMTVSDPILPAGNANRFYRLLVLP
jgi:hypothetical protein